MQLTKRIFFSVIIVLLWFGFVVDGAHALFTDSAILTDTTINTGSAHLLISNSQNPSSTLFDTSRPGFAINNLVPGESVDHYFFLKNTSDPDIDFDIAVQAIVARDTAQNSRIQNGITVSIYPVDDTGTVAQQGFTRPLAGMSNTLPTGFLVPQGETQRFILRVTLDPSFSEQNVGTTFDLIFTGTQHISAT